MDITALPYTELLFVTWYPGKHSCSCLLLQSVLCKTLSEEELSLICGNIFEGSAKYPWFNLLGTITYLVCKTAYCWPVLTALPRLTLHLCFSHPPFCQTCWDQCQLLNFNKIYFTIKMLSDMLTALIISGLSQSHILSTTIL